MSVLNFQQKYLRKFSERKNKQTRLSRKQMVCETCQKKLDKVICPDVWKDGASNTNEGGRKINENKLTGANKK
jgi:hypothetical protein